MNIQEIENSHKTEYERIVRENGFNVPAWDNLTDAQRAHVRVANEITWAAQNKRLKSKGS